MAWLTGAFLAGAARYILAALGVGIVSYAGTSLVLSQLTDYVTNGVSGLPAAAASVLTLLGFHEAFALIISAYSIKLTFAQLKRFKLL